MGKSRSQTTQKTGTVKLTERQIETVKLLQALKRGIDKPGAIVLRSLRTCVDREAAVLRGLNALKAKYPQDLAFANTGFTLGIVRCIVDAVLDSPELE